MNMKSGMVFLVAGAVGAFGSKAATQMVMGANNTGVSGYVGNAVATAVLAGTAHVFRNVLGKGAAMGVLAGGVLQILFRVLTDNTPFGQLTSSLGVGDYQMQSFVTPQRLKDPLNSAEIEIPPGWAPTVVQSSNAPPAGMKGFNRSGGGSYSGGGLYAT